MIEPREGLRALVDVPASAPEPVAVLRRRVEARRRRRVRVRVALATAATAVAAVAVVPLLDRASDAPTLVAAGPSETTTTSTAGVEFVAGQPLGTRLDITVPPGWEKLFALGDRVVLATRHLSDADLALAQLARNDAAFSAAFPADGVVLVVGGDPVEPKYTTAPDGTMLGAGPAFGLGAEVVLPGGVRVRRGDVPQSSVKIASYAGRSAPADRMAEAETIAASVRLVRTGDPAVLPAPPPAGSRPGLPAGTLPVPEAGLPEVARASVGGSTLILVAGQDCAYLRWADAQTSLPSYQPLAGACGTRPPGTSIETFGHAVPLIAHGPASQPSTVVMFRSGTGIARFSARLADGRTVPASIGTDGWGLIATDNRVVAVSGIDLQGRSVPETLVG